MSLGDQNKIDKIKKKKRLLRTTVFCCFFFLIIICQLWIELISVLSGGVCCLLHLWHLMASPLFKLWMIFELK